MIDYLEEALERSEALLEQVKRMERELTGPVGEKEEERRKAPPSAGREEETGENLKPSAGGQRLSGSAPSQKRERRDSERAGTDREGLGEPRGNNLNLSADAAAELQPARKPEYPNMRVEEKDGLKAAPEERGNPGAFAREKGGLEPPERVVTPLELEEGPEPPERVATPLELKEGPKPPGRAAAPLKLEGAQGKVLPEGALKGQAKQLEEPALLRQTRRLSRAAAFAVALRQPAGEELSRNRGRGDYPLSLRGPGAETFSGLEDIPSGRAGWSGLGQGQTTQMSAARLDWAEQTDRVFRRDSRRYDGNFYFY